MSETQCAHPSCRMMIRLDELGHSFFVADPANPGQKLLFCSFDHQEDAARLLAADVSEDRPEKESLIHIQV